HFAYFPQFTLVAGYLGFAGLLTFLYDSPKNSKVSFFLGMVAIFLSIIIRAEAFLLVGIGFFLGKFIFSGKEYFLQYRVRFLGVVLIFTCCVASKWMYEKNSFYADYLEFSQLRSAVIDHPVFYDLERNGGFTDE